MVSFMLGIFYHENQNPLLIKQLLSILCQPLAVSLAVFRVFLLLVPPVKWMKWAFTFTLIMGKVIFNEISVTCFTTALTDKWIEMPSKPKLIL